MASPSDGPTWSFAGVQDASTSTQSQKPHRRLPGTFHPEEPNGASSQPSERQHKAGAPQTDSSTSRTRRSWPARTCRICFETVQPRFGPPSDMPSFLEPRPQVYYVSEDPALGRLIRPCKCKGSSRYVHEGCLQRFVSHFLQLSDIFT